MKRVLGQLNSNLTLKILSMKEIGMIVEIILYAFMW